MNATLDVKVNTNTDTNVNTNANANANVNINANVNTNVAFASPGSVLFDPTPAMTSATDHPMPGAPVPVDLTIDSVIEAAYAAALTVAEAVADAEALATMADPAPVPTAGIRAGISVRAGRRADVPAVHRLVRHWARAGENLPRSEAEIREAADHGELAVAVRGGAVAACAILAPYDPVLAEIRSVGADPDLPRSGAGSAVVRHLVAVAALRGIRTVFVLTRAPSFFDRLGFVPTTIDTLPDKIRRDCVGCPRIDRCDEIAMVRPLPAARFSMSGPMRLAAALAVVARELHPVHGRRSDVDEMAARLAAPLPTARASASSGLLTEVLPIPTAATPARVEPRP